MKIRIRLEDDETVSDIDWLQSKENWKSLKTIYMVERERQFENKTECETTCYVGAIENNAEKFARADRNYCLNPAVHENIAFIRF